MWVCAPHLLPSPGAARFIYMFISLRRHIHFYSPCFQAHSYASAQTHQISWDSHPRVLYRPSSKKAQLSTWFRNARKVDFGIWSGTQVPPPFRTTTSSSERWFQKYFSNKRSFSGAESLKENRAGVGDGERPLNVLGWRCLDFCASRNRTEARVGIGRAAE